MSIMKKIGIVSSFNVLCGNATYSEWLAKGLEEKGYLVERIAVPVSLQKEDDKDALNAIIRKIRECDIVNVQFELGLYGSNPAISSKNVCQILKECPSSTTLTAHRLEKGPKDFLRMLKNQLRFKSFLQSTKYAVKNYYRQRYLFSSYSRVYKTLKKKNFTVISHTYRDYKILDSYYHIQSIMHPIMWPEHLAKPHSNQLKSKTVRVGVFGFISPHKNFALVILAFKHLLEIGEISSDSKLVIVGGHHPEAPGYGYPVSLARMKNGRLRDQGNTTTAEISQLISENKLGRQVEWLVGATDEEMAASIASVSLVVIPYAETGQSGSGISSQALQFAQRIAFGDTSLASQHSEMCNGEFILFDTSSVVSCGRAIVRALESESPRFKSQFSYENILNILSFGERK